MLHGMSRAVIFDLMSAHRLVHAHHESCRSGASTGRPHGGGVRADVRAHQPRDHHVELGRPGLSDARVREIDDRKEARYREIIAHRLPVMEGARELIDALRAAGFRIAVGSSAPPETSSSRSTDRPAPVRRCRARA